MLESLLFLILSLVALLGGAELSLQSAEKLGKALGLPALAVGLFIIAFGTSLPELFISHVAARAGRGQIAIGNIIGSNISNILLILGISLLFKKIIIDDKEISGQVGLHLLLTLALSAVLFFSKLYISSCVALLIFFIFFVGYLKRSIKKGRVHLNESGALAISDIEKVKSLMRLIAGFALLYYGGGSLVKVSTKLCQILGVSEYVISVIMIALGTSLPELVTSVLIVVRKRNPILVIGNVIGSNIFNVAFIMGSLFPYQIDLSRSFLGEIGALITSSGLLLICAMKKWALNRLLGIVLIATYLAMLAYWV